MQTILIPFKGVYMLQKKHQFLLRISFMLLIPLISLIHISLNVYRPNTKSIEMVIDGLIPFVSAFVVPYIYWFIYVTIGLFFLAVYDYKKYYGLLASIVSGMCVCFVIFYFFPTTVERPDVLGGGIFNYAMRFIYSTDNPYNCFPSIHVLNATLVSLFLFSRERSYNFNAWAIISAILINLSTMFTKQHVFLDVVAGTILAIIMYMVWSNEKIWDSKWFTRIEETISTENTTNDNPNVS